MYSAYGSSFPKVKLAVRISHDQIQEAGWGTIASAPVFVCPLFLKWADHMHRFGERWTIGTVHIVIYIYTY